MKFKILAIITLVFSLGLWFLNGRVLANETEDGWRILRDTTTNALKFFWYPTGGQSPSSMTFTTNGNVGIGTESPNNTLTVSVANTTSPASGGMKGLGIVNTDTSANSLSGILFTSNDSGGIGRHAGAIVSGKESTWAGTYPGFLSFWTRLSGGSAFERLRITSTGNVGIGTSNPSTALDITTGATNAGLRLHNTNSGADVNGVELTLDTSGNGFLWNHENSPFIMGIGITERMRISSNGNVGIGTANPQWKLDIDATTGSGLRFGSPTEAEIVSRDNAGGTSYRNLSVTANDFNIKTTTSAQGTSSTSRLFVQNTSGNVGIGTSSPGYKLEVVGSAGKSTGTSWTNTSDIRLKDIHGNYNRGLKEILQLHPVLFSYKKDNPLNLPSDEVSGFVAQEVQKVIPEAVSTRKDGYLELNVDPIHWATVNAVKELNAKYETTRKEQQGQIDKQAQEIETLKQEIQNLKQQISR